MKDSHVTVRISAALEKLLDRLARERAVPKSQLVREAVTGYFESSRAGTVERRVTGAELAARWADVPHLDPAEVEEFDNDLRDSRRKLPPLKNKWE